MSESLEDGMVYSWGDGKKGQLGHGRSGLNMQPTPKCGKAIGNVQCYYLCNKLYVDNVLNSLLLSNSVISLVSHKCRKVAAGGYHSLAVTGINTCSVLAFGITHTYV